MSLSLGSISTLGLLTFSRLRPTVATMKTFCVFAIAAFFTVPVFGDNHTRVNGYTKKNGKLVESHERSNKNRSFADNWSTRGNANPHTGNAGTKRTKR
jgi:hypothetical protein